MEIANSLQNREGYVANKGLRVNGLHKDDLFRSGLTPDTIIASGIYSGHSAQIAELLNCPNTSLGMVIPYLNVEDETYVRVKLDDPGRDRKYRSPKGKGNRLYVPPIFPREVLSDPTEMLWITEGEKKALKGCQEGLACIAVSGVWCWRTKDEEGHSVPVSDLDRIEWNGRTVTIVYDSDAAKNKDVARAEAELARELARRGALVHSLRLPAAGDGKKVGLDDYLIEHAVEEFRALPTVRIAPQVLATGLGQFLGREFPPPVPLVEGVIPSEGCGWIAGEEKLGKSFYALEEALCLALGMPVCGKFTVPERQRVLFIEEEDSPQRVKDRADALLRGHGKDPDDPAVRAELDEWFKVAVWSNFSLDDPDKVLSLEKGLEGFKPRIVYLDALRKMTTRDLNSQHEVSKLVNTLDELRRKHGCIFRILHHYRKGQAHGRTARGSQEIIGSFVLGAWAEVSLFVEPIGKQYGIAKAQVQTKDGMPPEPFKIVIESEGPPERPTVIRLRVEELGKDQKALELKEKVYGLVGNLEATAAREGESGVSIASIALALERKVTKWLRDILEALVTEGRIRVAGSGAKGAKLYRQVL
jgi:muconolactone delta-isomerase